MKNKFLLIGILIGMMLITACKKDDSPEDLKEKGIEIEPLSWLEEEAAQKWSRYHAYDGSYMYYILNGDRTACYFEISSSGSRKNNKCYTNWEIDETLTKTIDGAVAYALKIEGSGLTSYFSYVNDVIYKGGYSNLGMGPSTSSRDCECDW